MGLNINKAYDLIAGKLEAWAETFIKMLPNFILSFVILITFYFIAKMASKLVRNLLEKTSFKISLKDLIGRMVYLVIIIVGTFIALSVLKLDKAVTSLLAGAGVIGLALSFAFQDTAANFLSGIVLSIKSPFRIGDILKTNGFYGKVQKLNLRTTLIKTFQGQEVYIPNKHIFENPLTNYSSHYGRRVDLDVGVSYGDDLDKVKETTINAIKNIRSIDSSKDISLFFKEFGDSSINFVVRFWAKDTEQGSFLEARSNAIMAIKKAFDENDIMIPFPIRTLDFGIKGGEKLTEMLSVQSEESLSNNHNHK